MIMHANDASVRTVFAGGIDDLRSALAHMPLHAALAIVGSTQLGRTRRAWWLVDRSIRLLDPAIVVSGGAPGIDTLAKEAAERWDVPTDVRSPEVRRWWSADGKKGFAERNLEIATACTALVRVGWAKSKTYGSGWTRDRAREMGKPTAEFWLEK